MSKIEITLTIFSVSYLIGFALGGLPALVAKLQDYRRMKDKKDG